MSQTKEGILESAFMTISFGLYWNLVLAHACAALSKECHFREIIAKHACAIPSESRVIDVFVNSVRRMAGRKAGLKGLAV